MERRYRVRLEALIADAEVPPGLLRGALPRLEGFLQPFVAALGSAEQRTHARHYVQGLLSDLPGKYAESIAYLHDRERQGLQKFIGQAGWDHRPLLGELASQVGAELGEPDGKAHKCTLCYDRLKGGFEPACAKACPTDSITFGPLDELHQRAQERVKKLHQQGVTQAHLYGAPDGSEVGPLHAFFLLTDRPEVYNLPAAPNLPSRRVRPGLVRGFATMLGVAVAAAAVFAAGARRA